MKKINGIRIVLKLFAKGCEFCYALNVDDLSHHPQTDEHETAASTPRQRRFLFQRSP